MMKRVLILGAGMVAKPMIEYLLEKGITITVASPMDQRATEMIAGNPLGKSVKWSSNERDQLESMIAEHDVVVSLLPYKLHGQIASVCLKYKKHLVTTSYVQPEIAAMNDEAVAAGVLFMNEIGLDPGIDHMSAMKIIDRVHDKGGKIVDFYSICGALPAPEAANNPFGYKFSWSPKGVILASKNSGSYLKNGVKINIPPEDLFKDRFNLDFPEVGILDVYPNRDSISYIDIYNIEEVKTIYRGTFRHRGWCELLDVIKALNLLDDQEKDYSGKSYAELVEMQSGLSIAQIRGSEGARYGITDKVIKAFEWLGLIGKEAMGYEKSSSFEIVSDLMIGRMILGDNERDMVALKHLFYASYPDGKDEVIISTMLDFGTPAQNTAVARTVALPAAICVRNILEGNISITGVHRPVMKEVYLPVLEELEQLGIRMTEEFGLSSENRI